MREYKKLASSLPASSQGIAYVLKVGQGEVDEIIEIFVSVYPERKATIIIAARQLARRGEEREK